MEYIHAFNRKYNSNGIFAKWCENTTSADEIRVSVTQYLRKNNVQFVQDKEIKQAIYWVTHLV